MQGLSKLTIGFCGVLAVAGWAFAGDETGKTDAKKEWGAPKKAASKDKPTDSKDKPAMPLTAETVDSFINKTLTSAKLSAQPQSTDGEFLRRVYLDLTGRLPNRKKVLAFLADKSPKKREVLVDQLMATPEYVEHSTDFWMDVLLSTRAGDKRIENISDLRRWVEGQVRKNTPYNQFVSRLIRAQGYVDQNGAVAFVLGFRRTPLELASTTTRLFMGAQIECAQCHDHPFADWKQKQFLEMAAYFSRFEVRNKVKTEAEIAQELARLKGKQRKRYIQQARRRATMPGLFERARGELVVNERGEPLTRKNRAVSKESKTIEPAFVLKLKGKNKASRNRREAYARMLTSPKNKYFSQMAVNRTWARFFGRGVNNPVDDLSDVSVNTHPEMLMTLADSFVATGYNVKALIRAIVLSETYQRSSQPPTGDTVTNTEEQGDPLLMLYGRMPVRPISARPLARMLARAAVPVETRNGRNRARGLVRTLENMLKARNMDMDRYEETLQEALFMQNSPQLHRVGRGDDYVGYLLRTQPNDRERLTRVFLNILTRPASPRELERYEAYIKKVGNTREAYEDIVWVLLNTSEFRYNH